MEVARGREMAAPETVNMAQPTRTGDTGPNLSPAPGGTHRLPWEQPYKIKSTKTR